MLWRIYDVDSEGMEDSILSNRYTCPRVRKKLQRGSSGERAKTSNQPPLGLKLCGMPLALYHWISNRNIVIIMIIKKIKIKNKKKGREGEKRREVVCYICGAATQCVVMEVRFPFAFSLLLFSSLRVALVSWCKAWLVQGSMLCELKCRRAASSPCWLVVVVVWLLLN